MIERYTYLRKNLILRDEQLTMAARRNVFQEQTISELRQFIEENIEPALEIIEEINKNNMKYKYKKEGSTELSMYYSTVLKMQRDTELHKLKNKILELNDEIEYLNSFVESLELKASINLQHE